MQLNNDENLSIKNSLLKVEENYLDIRNIYQKLTNISSNLENNDLTKGVEKVDLLYFNESSDSNINLGLTYGIISETVVSLDCSKYKYLRIYYSVYENAWNSIGTNANILYLNLDRKINDYSVAENKIGFYTTNKIYYTFDIITFYNHSTKKFHCLFFFQDIAVKLADIMKYFVYKIEGVR